MRFLDPLLFLEPPDEERDEDREPELELLDLEPELDERERVDEELVELRDRVVELLEDVDEREPLELRDGVTDEREPLELLDELPE